MTNNNRSFAEPELRMFDLVRTGAVEQYKLNISQFDKFIKEAKPEVKRNIKKAKNILLHHYKQMFITNALHLWTWWLNELQVSQEQKLDEFSIPPNLDLIETEIVEQLINISQIIGFDIDERDKDYMTDKMKFFKEQYNNLKNNTKDEQL